MASFPWARRATTPEDSYRICGTLADGSYVVSAFNVKDYGAAGGALSPFLDSYDPETGARRTDLTHKYLEYSYRFLEQYETVDGNDDWLMYFTLRNPSGYLPMWANDYAAAVVVAAAAVAGVRILRKKRAP